MVDEAVDVLLLKGKSLGKDFTHFSREAEFAYHLTVYGYLFVPVQLQGNHYL